MKIISISFLLLMFAACKQHNTRTDQNMPAIQTYARNDSLRLIHLFGDGFYKSSFLSIWKDTLFIIQDANYSHQSISNFKKLYFDRSDSKFNYQSFVKQQLINDSLEALHKSNLIPGVLKEAKNNSDFLFNKILEALGANSGIKFLNKDCRISRFAECYYAVNRRAPDSLYQINLNNREVKVFSIKDRPFDALGILLCDIDEDGNPEIILFHENMVPQTDRLLFEIYSLRVDSINVDIQNYN